MRDAASENKTTKRIALVALALLSLLGPVAEALLTGHVSDDPLGKWSLAEAVLTMPLIYAWYYADKRALGFRSGALQNVAVAALAFIGLPVYFFRSRGFRRGVIASAKSLGVLLCLSLLDGAGEWAGAALAA
ncbi:MAG TPA: hypothetical protein VH105_25955 [Burkholderiales bacterium]|nr:hypothetical protein [Burkholderiales bacterium]